MSPTLNNIKEQYENYFLALQCFPISETALFLFEFLRLYPFVLLTNIILGQMCAQLWRNDTDSGKPNYSEKTLS